MCDQDTCVYFHWPPSVVIGNNSKLEEIGHDTLQGVGHSSLLIKHSNWKVVATLHNNNLPCFWIIRFMSMCFTRQKIWLCHSTPVTLWRPADFSPTRLTIMTPAPIGHRSTLGAHMALRTHKSPMAVGVTYDRYGKGPPPAHNKTSPRGGGIRTAR